MTPPRTTLATLPTPLVRADGLERALDAGPIYLKRDDLTGFGVAGNKARALEYLLGDATTEDADVLVVGGSQHSNFCAAAAMAAALVGLQCDVLFAGAAPRSEPVAVALARVSGGHLHFLPTTPRDRVDEAVLSHAETLRSRGRTPYALPRGGATAVGAVGYAFAARELAEQSTAVGVTVRTVVVATGSGGTQAGLVAGQVGYGLGWRVIGASVSRPAQEVGARVLSLARACAGRLELTLPTAEDVHVQDLRGPGFGLPSAEDRSSAALALRHAGLLLDHHYGSKALSLMRSLLTSGAPTPLVYVHTGGLPGALAALTEGVDT